MPLPCGSAQSTSPTVPLATLSLLEAISRPKALSRYKVQLIILAFCIKQRKKKDRGVVQWQSMCLAPLQGILGSFPSCAHTNTEPGLDVVVHRRPR